MLHRAYALLTLKALDGDFRTIEGIASTPEPDRMGDVVEPRGAKFKNPLPMLLFHDATKPVATVKLGKPDEDGIRFTATFPDPETITSAPLRERITEARSSIKAGLIRGVSIGFRVLDDGIELLRSGGVRFTKIEILELSLVAIPANAAAVIETIKSIDTGYLAASGTGAGVVPRPSSGVADRVARASKDASPMKTIADQISAFEATRQAKSARKSEIMTKAGEAGVTLDKPEEEEYDGLETEVKAIDAHLVRLHALEEEQKAAAVPVNGKTAEHASESRGGIVTVKPKLPPGTAFTRYAMALAASRGSRMEAAEYAKRWDGSTPEVGMVLKAAMAAGTTTDADWAAPLVVYQNLTSEFVELLRPATIIGRIPGLRRVPFNVTMPTQTQGATANWVGQGAPKPVSELKFGQLSLGMAKAAGIVVLSEELVRSSNPSAEAIVRQDLIDTITAFLDVQFIDPSVAAVTNVSPASITNGITAVDSTGVTAAAFVADVKTLLATFTAANLSLSGAVWLMSETQAQALAMMLNPLGQPVYPSITMTGGTLFGLPVITSQNIPSEGGSPAGSRIILVKANEILLADDGGVTLDVSREASLQMNSAPDNPATASTVMVSLWQNNLVGLRAERFINWVRRRDAAVAILEGAVYSG